MASLKYAAGPVIDFRSTTSHVICVRQSIGVFGVRAECHQETPRKTRDQDQNAEIDQ